jgi:hypothetical protein
VPPVDPTSTPSVAPADGTPNEAELASASPYRNLWVPLIVVPALIGIVLVVVFVLFGAMAGKEASPRENLARMRDGGKNERLQAAFNLVRQLNERQEQVARGDAPAWSLDASFVPELEDTYAKSDLAEPEQLQQAFICAMLLFQLDAEGSLERLLALAEVPASADQDGQVRFDLLTSLGAWAPRMDDAQRGQAGALLVRQLESPDPGLVRAAAMALQKYPGDETRGALRGLLTASELDLRGQAAISLSHLGDDSGEPVLREMLDRAAYATAHANQPEKYARAADISQSRRKALEALVRLGKPECRALVDRFAREEPDLELREAALMALESSRQP